MKLPPARPLLIAVAVIAAVYLAIRALGYVASQDLPFAFYYDLGVNNIATEYMSRAIGSWPDFIDNVGWASWGDIPNFDLNPTLTYFALVPLARVVGNVWEAIKVTQVLQEIVAFAAAAALYATLVRRDWWAIGAGLLYAALPDVALTIRGNLDFGWASAVAPLPIVAGCFLLRRYGPWALPLCGVVCGLLGFCITGEYLFVSSIPSYLFLCAVGFSRKNPIGSLAGAAAGLVFAGAIGSFFTFTTFAAQTQFMDAVAHTLSLQRGSDLGSFSETPATLFALIQREFVISDIALFNASSDLPIMYGVGVVVCLAAIWAALRIARRGTPVRHRAALVLGFLLAALSLGTSNPVGALTWHALDALPGLSMLRTPDRFVVLPFLFLMLVAVAGLCRLSNLRVAFAPQGAVAILGLMLCAFLTVDNQQHWLGLDPTANAVEPDLAAIRAIVERAGGRTISYAFLKGGSQFYTTAYGVPVPTIWYHWDPSSHYAGDGLKGAGIFARGATHTVIASPNWSIDSPTLPDANLVERYFPGKTIFAGASGLIVKRIGDRAELSRVATSCIAGGPGLLDWADALPELQGYAFLREDEPCARHAYFDYDPRDVAGVRAIAQFPAGTLLFDEPPLRDADYTFLVGRTFVNDPWYRNSVDGDAPASPGGARNISHGRSLTIDAPANPHAAPRKLLLRLASRVPTQISVTDGSTWTATMPIVPAPGLRWYETALPLRRNATHLQLRVAAFPVSPPAAGTWNGIAFDGASIVEPAPAPRDASPASKKGDESPSDQDAALFTIAALQGAQNPASGAAVPTVRARVWIPAGSFAARIFGVGVRERAANLTIDGRPAAASGALTFARPAYHTIELRGLAVDDRVLAFVGTHAALAPVTAAGGAHDSTFDWKLTSDRPTALELASYPDNQWFVDDASGKRIASGVRCDLVNTCFDHLPAGALHVYHLWQPLLRNGILTSFATLVIALVLAILPSLLPRRRRTVRHA